MLADRVSIFIETRTSHTGVIKDSRIIVRMNTVYHNGFYHRVFSYETRQTFLHASIWNGELGGEYVLCQNRENNESQVWRVKLKDKRLVPDRIQTYPCTTTEIQRYFRAHKCGKIKKISSAGVRVLDSHPRGQGSTLGCGSLRQVLISVHTKLLRFTKPMD